uniref:Tetratricopeptide repeat protein 36 n=1 Tax=Macaca fascicularis TaxID=9541 RepID=A0A2K5UVZ3_MACFA
MLRVKDRETLLMKGWSSSFQINFLLEAPPSPRPSLFSHPESPFGILELGTMGTPNDRAVLQAIFNPDTPFGDIVGLDLGEEAEKEERKEDEVFPQAQLEQSKALELQGVMAAEAGDLSTALERFGQAICLLPERASAYNNRAQARRLQGDVAGALEDLERAVELSGGRGRAARQSFVQRGLLARLQGRDDDARRDFERAARLGSPSRGASWCCSTPTPRCATACWPT